MKKLSSCLCFGLENRKKIKKGGYFNFVKWLPKQPKNKIHIIKSGLLLGLWVFDGEWNLWMCQKHLVKTEVLQNRNAEFRKWLNPKFYATIQAEKKPCHQNSLSFEMKLGCKEVGRLFLGLSYICLPTHIYTTSMPLDNLKEGFFFQNVSCKRQVRKTILTSKALMEILLWHV